MLNISNQNRREIFALIVFIILSALSFSEKRVTVQKVKEMPNIMASRKEIVFGNTSKKQVIFTFDGGDKDTSAETILNILDKYHIKSSFFLTGKFAEKYPETVKDIASHGHEIYNHTYDHPHLTELEKADIGKELSQADEIISKITGRTTKPYFRAPYGDRDGRVLDAAYSYGYESIYWSADARDWEEEQGITADEVEYNILNNLSPGSIYLMHLGDNITGNILEDVIKKVEGRGYIIVSLANGI